MTCGVYLCGDGQAAPASTVEHSRDRDRTSDRPWLLGPTVATSLCGVRLFPHRVTHLRAAPMHVRASKGGWGGDGCAGQEHKRRQQTSVSPTVIAAPGCAHGSLSHRSHPRGGSSPPSCLFHCYPRTLWGWRGDPSRRRNQDILSLGQSRAAGPATGTEDHGQTSRRCPSQQQARSQAFGGTSFPAPRGSGVRVGREAVFSVSGREVTGSLQAHAATLALSLPPSRVLLPFLRARRHSCSPLHPDATPQGALDSELRLLQPDLTRGGQRGNPVDARPS